MLPSRSRAWLRRSASQVLWQSFLRQPAATPGCRVQVGASAALAWKLPAQRETAPTSFSRHDRREPTDGAYLQLGVEFGEGEHRDFRERTFDELLEQSPHVWRREQHGLPLTRH
jgi:hypothetical protein